MDDDLSRSQARAAAPDPPNLKDTALARSDQRLEFDVKDLDRFDTLTKDDA
ncbi:MAG: hypothetical protein ACRD3C_22500 [Vicinamibacterales bacterium]